MICRNNSLIRLHTYGTYVRTYVRTQVHRVELHQHLRRERAPQAASQPPSRRLRYTTAPRTLHRASPPVAPAAGPPTQDSTGGVLGVRRAIAAAQRRLRRRARSNRERRERPDQRQRPRGGRGARQQTSSTPFRVVVRRVVALSWFRGFPYFGGGAVLRSRKQKFLARHLARLTHAVASSLPLLFSPM